MAISKTPENFTGVLKCYRCSKTQGYTDSDPLHALIYAAEISPSLVDFLPGAADAGAVSNPAVKPVTQDKRPGAVDAGAVSNPAVKPVTQDKRPGASLLTSVSNPAVTSSRNGVSII